MESPFLSLGDLKEGGGDDSGHREAGVPDRGSETALQGQVEGDVAHVDAGPPASACWAAEGAERNLEQ